MLFAQSLDPLISWSLDNLPIVVGVGVTLVVLIVCLVQRCGRRKLVPEHLIPPPTPTPASSVVNPENELIWDPPEQSYADRRGAIRREGSPVRVTLASSAFRDGIGDGVIIDRSTGGLRIALSSALAPGSTMQVRAANAPDTVGFVTVIIRSCRKNGDLYEVGCEFEKTPPWNVLLLFG